MDVNDLDLGPKFFPGLTQRHTAVSKLVENGYSKNNCQDDNFDECFARYFDEDSKTYVFTVNLNFEENDLMNATGQFTWTRNAKNK